MSTVGLLHPFANPRIPNKASSPANCTWITSRSSMNPLTTCASDARIYAFYSEDGWREGGYPGYSAAMQMMGRLPADTKR
ncbi:hypothetical protein L210DRAFT_954504 [Boletus edulis BED1]|uniref:Uncharacterized protein n=1 Tax=Boletus edulis BED1 TaxID=1328754 RepID=A0AAD4BE67_BOLED|nr:hypothetical protein L210DRAFT_954504 [Boletus edulis BED1]